MEPLLSKIQVSLKLLLVMVFVLSVNSFAYSSKPKWFSKLYQIKLMSTTRQEAEKLFGNLTITDTSDGKWSRRVKYRIREGDLAISYSLGKCSETKGEGYNVPKDVVIGVYLNLKKQVSISELEINLSDFHKIEITDLKGVFTYANTETGERHLGTLKGITEIGIFPSKDQEKLSCVNQNKINRSTKGRIEIREIIQGTIYAYNDWSAQPSCDLILAQFDVSKIESVFHNIESPTQEMKLGVEGFLGDLNEIL